MISGRPLITVCPAGRRRFLELLVPYLLRERAVIDRHDFWLNTTDREDIAYLENLEKQHPEFFRIVRVPNSAFTPRGKPKLGLSFHIGAFYPYAAEPGSVYVRLDDDIVYVSPGGIRALAEYRVLHPEPFLVYPTIINNSIMTHLLQAEGVFGQEKGAAEYALKGRGWNDGRLAEHLHRKFIAAVKRGEGERWRVREHTLGDYMTVSVNCMSWLGKDMAECKDQVGDFEEEYLATTRPRELGRHNRIAPVASVVHFSYGEQRAYLERTNLLSEYQRLLRR